MKKIILAASVLVCSAVCAAPPKDFAQRVERARTAVGVPGMAIAIVEGETVTFAKGFGVKAIGRSDPVDAGHDLPDRLDRQGGHRGRARDLGRSGRASAGMTR